MIEFPELDGENFNRVAIVFGDMIFSRQCPICGRFMKFPEKMAMNGKWATCKKHGEQIAYFIETI